MQSFVSFSCIIKLACFLSLIGYVQCSGLICQPKVTFIYGNYDGQAYSAENFSDVMKNPNFNFQKSTAIYSYGFTQTPNMPSVRNIVDAYMQNGDFNFMVVSCDNIISYTLFSANSIANAISGSLLTFFEAGYSKFHLIGFSLGAQISGLIGRRVIRLSNGRHKIPRITGLDPGQIAPLFGLIIANLNADDAEFVDVIHAETKSFGSLETVGHANFWVNGGILQPMCKNRIDLFTSICSHLMAPKYWAESVSSKNPNAFLSTRCESYESFLNQTCENPVTTSMGLYANLQSRGNFYLQTNMESPYSKD